MVPPVLWDAGLSGCLAVSSGPSWVTSGGDPDLGDAGSLYSRARSLSLARRRRLGVRDGDVALGRDPRGLAPRPHAELREDRPDVVVHGLLGDVQAGGDVGVAQVAAEQRQHLQLAGSEPGRVGGR